MSKTTKLRDLAQKIRYSKADREAIAEALELIADDMAESEQEKQAEAVHLADTAPAPAPAPAKKTTRKG